MSKYKYLLCGYNLNKERCLEHFVDVKLIGIYNTYDDAHNFQKRLGIIKSEGKCIKSDKFCTWIHEVELIDGTLSHSLSLRNTHHAITPVIKQMGV